MTSRTSGPSRSPASNAASYISVIGTRGRSNKLERKPKPPAGQSIAPSLHIAVHRSAPTTSSGTSTWCMPRDQHGAQQMRNIVREGHHAPVP